MSDRSQSERSRVTWRDEPPIFERSNEGRVGVILPSSADDPGIDDAVDASLRRDDLPGFPEVSEVDVVRHYTRLSRRNTAVDLATYPLGSCTMKYNPRINEGVARMPGFAEAHPLQPVDTAQGCLAVMWELEQALIALTGMSRVSLQPAAGAQGEFAGVQMIRQALDARGEQRSTILIPDSAHGTNPASANLAGFKVQELLSNNQGRLDIEDLERHMSEDVAGLMLTVPNTLGVFEHRILEISRIVHDKGGYVYGDGANFNAFVGKASPGAMGIDVLHLNLHKTFSTPHGGGGPGAGPVAAAESLEAFLPAPLVERDADGNYYLDHDRELAIGRTRSFHGQFGILLRALTYIYALGGEGLADVAELAVLNANYLRSRLEPEYALPYTAASLHEAVFSDARQLEHGVSAMDIAKRLIDFGFHPPTVYFPLIVSGALMIEPTETESKEDLDDFIGAMLEIAREAREDPDLLHEAPHSSPVRRCDEAGAARRPVLRWQPAEAPADEE